MALIRRTQKKGVSNIIASIILVIVVVSISGVAYSFVRSFSKTQRQSLEVADIYCEEGRVTIEIRNLGDLDINSLNVTQIEPDGDTADSWSGTINPQEIGLYKDDCTGPKGRQCRYLIIPEGGRNIEAFVKCVHELQSPGLYDTDITLWLDGTEGDITVDYGDSVNITAIIDSSTWPGPDPYTIPISIYVNYADKGYEYNRTERSADVDWFPAGTYEIKAIWDGNETFSASGRSRQLTVNPAVTTLHLEINGTEDNESINAKNGVNITVWSDDKYMAGTSLLRNGTGYPNPHINYYDPSNNVTYNFTAYLDHQNYTASPVSLFLEVNVTSPPAPPTPPTIPDPDLVGHWSFNDSSDPTDDESGYENHGDLINGPAFDTGVDDDALTFDGGDYVRIASDSELDITDEITISAWVNPATESGYRRIVSKQYVTNRDTGNSCYQLGIHNENHWRFSAGGVFDVTNASAPRPVAGNWYHVVGTYDGTNIRIYLDGEVIYRGIDSGSIRVNVTEPVTIGGGEYDGIFQYGFPGTIDEVKIWNRSLTADEIYQEFKRHAPDPIGLWLMDDDGDNRADDTSGNSNHCWFINSPQWTDGIEDRAVHFPGVDQKLSCGTSSLLETKGDMSVSAWVFAENASGGTGRLVASKYTWVDSDTSLGWNFGDTWNYGYFGFSVYNDSTDFGDRLSIASIDDYFDYNLFQWHQIVGVYRPSSYVRIYMDGELIDTDTNDVIPRIVYNAPSDPLGIGARGSNMQGPFNGTIDKVKIWNRVLNEREIVEEYQEHAFEYIAEFKFDEASGNTITDSTPNKNHGAIISGNGNERVPGVSGNGIRFSDSTEFVTFGDKFEIGPEGTIEFWMKLPHDMSDSLYDERPYGKENDYELRIAAASEQAIFDMGGTTTLTSHRDEWYKDRWYHLAYAWNTTDSSLYLDGYLENGGNGLSLPQSNLDFRIGMGGANRGGDSGSFNGTIDEFKIHNSYMTPAQANESFWQNYPGPYGTNLFTNPSFENGLTDWDPVNGDVQLVSDVVYDRNYAIRMQDLTGDYGDECTDWQVIPISYGEIMTVSIYSKANNIIQGTNPWDSALLQGRWINSTHSLICCADDYIGERVGSWDWMRSMRRISPPTPDINAVRYRICLYSNGQGTLWADAIKIELEEDATPFSE